MEHPNSKDSNAGDLVAVGPILAEHKAVRALLKKTFGEEQLETALDLLKTGQLDEGLGAESSTCSPTKSRTKPSRSGKACSATTPRASPFR